MGSDIAVIYLHFVIFFYLISDFYSLLAPSTGSTTIYRNSFGAPGDDLKHNQVSLSICKMLAFIFSSHLID